MKTYLTILYVSRICPKRLLRWGIAGAHASVPARVSASARADVRAPADVSANVKVRVDAMVEVGQLVIDPT